MCTRYAHYRKSSLEARVLPEPLAGADARDEHHQLYALAAGSGPLEKATLVGRRPYGLFPLLRAIVTRAHERMSSEKQQFRKTSALQRAGTAHAATERALAKAAGAVSLLRATCY